MNEALFELLDALGFKSGRGRIDLDDLMRLALCLPRKYIVQAVELATSTITYASRPATTPFEFSASSTYGGAPFPCAGVVCRVNRIKELGYFAALYADRVLIPSPFSYLSNDADLEQQRCDFGVAIFSCLHLKPLVTAGIVEFVHAEEAHACVQCCAKLAGRSSANLKSLMRELETEYRERVNYYLESEGRRIYVCPDGRDDLFDSHRVTRQLHPVPKAMRQLVRSSGGRVLLPREEVRQLEFPKEYALGVARDILSRDILSARFSTAYLTRRAIDLKIADRIGQVRDSKAIFGRDLEHSVPLLQGIGTHDLLKLRNNESDAFRTYQLALRKAAAESSSSDFAAIFADVVEPEVRRMNAALKTAKRTLLRGVAANVAGASATVAIALFSGLITPTVAGVIATLGGAHFSRKVVADLCELYKQEPENARQNAFFFLWKASQDHR